MDDLISRIERYLSVLPAHVRGREGAGLLASALDALKATQARHKEQAIACATQIYSDNPHMPATTLAEAVAHTLSHDEWLDSETHWIWDVACDIVIAG